MRAELVLVLAAAALISSGQAWITSYGFRQLANELMSLPNASLIKVQEPLRIAMNKDEALRELVLFFTTTVSPPASPVASPKLRNRAEDREEGEEVQESEATVARTQTTKEGDTTTTTPKFNDPNFIPGEHLDPNGETSFVTPKPVTDALVDFVEKINEKKTELWQTGVWLIVTWILQGSFLILSMWVAGLFIPLYTLTNEMGELLPYEEEDRIDKMLELAELYEQNPLRFAHLPGFEIKGFDPLIRTGHKDDDNGLKKKRKKRKKRKKKKKKKKVVGGAKKKKKGAGGDKKKKKDGKKKLKKS